MKKNFIQRSTLALTVGVLAAFPAVGADVALKNPSFSSDIGLSQGWSTLPGGTGTPTLDPIPGWVITGIDTGIFYSYGDFNRPSGEMMAFIGGTYSNLGTATQNVGAIKAGVYTFSIDVGWRQGIQFAGYNLQLLSNGAPIAENYGLTTWSPSEQGQIKRISVSTIVSENSNLIGTTLAIRFSAINPSYGIQTAFDNAQLDYTPSGTNPPIGCIPEK